MALFHVGSGDGDDSLLKKHVIVQAIEIVSRPLHDQLTLATDDDEIQKIKVQIKELR